MQAALCNEHNGLVARLLCGSTDAGGMQTWMETYAHASIGIDEALQAVIEARAGALAGHLDGPRHVEVFTAID